MASFEYNINNWHWTTGQVYTIVPYSVSYDPIKNQSTVTFDTLTCRTWANGYQTTYASISITATATDSGNSVTSSAETEKWNSTSGSGYGLSYPTPSPISVVVQHSDSAGAKSVRISSSTSIRFYDDGWGTVSGSGSVTVATGEYYPASSLTASNGTLGVSQTLTVERVVDSYTHTITYACGTASGTICTKSSDLSIAWTPPMSLASQNANGTSVVVQFTITTYTGDTVLDTKTTSITCAIPDSVKPSFTVAVSDAMGYADNFGGYVQTKSKLNIVVDITTLYGASVASVKVVANGETHNTSSVTTGVLKNSGNNTISVEVIDSRGRKASGNTTVAVLAYSAPAISLLTYNRCDSDGTDNVLGDYAEITFSNAVTSLSGKNAVSYTLEYKKTSASEYATADMTAFAGLYSVTNGIQIIPADSGSSYDVRLTVADSFGSAVATLLVDTGSAIMHWLPKGVGMAIGKIAEKLQTLELGWNIHMNSNRIEGLGDPVEDQDAVPWKVAKGLHVRNLLDNSDFTNPVNQRGATSYTAQGYTIDRWRAYNAGLTVNVCDGYVELVNTTEATVHFLQPLENKISAGKSITIAYKLQDGSIYTGSGTVGVSGGCAFIYTNDYSAYYNCGSGWMTIGIYAGKSIKLEWIAIYEGEYTAETLPTYQPKGYGVELTECMRYYQKGDWNVFTREWYGVHNGAFPFYVPMRVVPTIVTLLSGMSDVTITPTKTTRYGCSWNASGETYLYQWEASADL